MPISNKLFLLFKLFIIDMSKKTIKTASLGFLRIGRNRELKFALEKFWGGKISASELENTAKEIRALNWGLQKEFDFVPSGDFSYYDHVLDLSFEFGNIPSRYDIISDNLQRYFAVARGYQKGDIDLYPCDMSKWFNTNYHYIVPEFHADIVPKYKPRKFVSQFLEARNLGVNTRPVIIGPVSYLLLGREKTATREDVLPKLLPCYTRLLLDLKSNGCKDIQIDEPFLCTELSDKSKSWYQDAYKELAKCGLNIHLVTYFDELAENAELAFALPVESVHFDISESDLPRIPETEKTVSLGLVNGRNVWKNDLGKSLDIAKGVAKDRNLIIATSCSLLHVPYSVADEKRLKPGIKDRLAFATEKLHEVHLIADALRNGKSLPRLQYDVVRDSDVRTRVEKLGKSTARKSPFAARKKKQKVLGIPLFPTTTIGSFPQDAEIRKNRSDFKKNVKTEAEYNEFCRSKIAECIKKQEDLGLDVLVHGEFERNDMVEYFGENLNGFCFTENAWVQSYGSRCVKPPIIYGDVSRIRPITIEWSKFAQSCSKKHVKGMLTGPVTILKWSFVRDDIPQEETCRQIAVALQDEVLDLEGAGIKIIQIDEPAIREILPVRRSKWDNVLSWAVECFRISCQKVKDETQIHTHVCYSDFNDIIKHIIALDADVLSIESSRSDLEVLAALKDEGYINDIGPGVWDIHSPRIPSVDEITAIVKRALCVLKPEQIWINPDCGLKTRNWPEAVASIRNFVAVAKEFRNGKV